LNAAGTAPVPLEVTTEPGGGTATTTPGIAVKPAPSRLYGRQRSHHPLRPRQQRLLDLTLPRLRFPETLAGDLAAAFGRRPAELWLEVGFGGGEHSLAQHAAHPDVGLIACEVFENGLCSLLTRLVPECAEETAPLPAMLRLWDDDARILLQALPEACLDRVFLLFPDPWPKARHAKRRFVHPQTVPLVASRLRAGGEWRIASDDPTYQNWVAEVMAAQSLFAPAEPARSRPQGWPPTRYEAKALAAGRMPLYWSFIRR
jgi:tRNA (guanine-N7-)-methyltransferase